MAGKPQDRPPKYGKHKATGSARVRIHGQDIWLGKYGSDESFKKYEEAIARWRAGLDVKIRARSGLPVSVAVLADRYLDFVDGYYRKRGKPTSEASCIRAAVRVLLPLAGRMGVEDFGPIRLKEVREAMIRRGWTRGTVNKNVGRVVRMFKWGVAEEIVPPSIHQGLASVEAIQAGRRPDAKDNPPVQSVAIEDVEAVKPHVSSVVWDMIQVQLLTGARPGEIVGMRPADIEQTGEVWAYRPRGHKTEHHGRQRVVFIGPKAQLILRTYLARLPKTPLFSPREAEAERHAQAETHRRPDQELDNPRTTRRLRSAYSRDSYRRAIARACAKAGIDTWHPHQLRHTRATELERAYGRDDARVVLGHGDPKVTDIYIDKDFAKARRIMGEVG